MEAEQAVARIGADIARLDAALAGPDLYADAAKAREMSIERGRLAKRLGAAEEVWVVATEAFERAAGKT